MTYTILGKTYEVPKITDEEWATYLKVRDLADIEDVLIRLESLDDEHMPAEPPSMEDVKRAAALYRNYQIESHVASWMEDLDRAMEVHWLMKR